MHYSGESAFSLDQLYHICVKFLKEKEGKAFHLSYQDRLQLSAYSKQATHGAFRADASPGVGWLDVVGSDRKATWKSLGDLSRERSQEKFVEILDRACPLLGPYLEAHLNEKLARERLQMEAEEQAREAERQLELERERERQRHLEQQRRLAEEAAAQERAKLEMKLNSGSRSETAQPALLLPPVHGPATAAPAGKDDSTALSRRLQQESQIRAALSQQTAAQFRQYAQEQHPSDQSKQEELVLQLQEQHFHQYMTQVYQQQLRRQEELVRQQREGSGDLGGVAAPATPVAATASASSQVGEAAAIEAAHPTSNGSALGSPIALMSAPTMWTNKQVTAAQFKANLAADSDAKLKVGPGEVVTVRVPTHEDGNCIVWEFATDHYDIGFGVNFEWTPSPSDRVTVHISESSDEEDEAEDSDPKGRLPQRTKASDKAVDEIIPVYRRDCQHEVYCGSHQYPGRGVYLLKFDNSYSLWRSKWLYYRVYYTK